MNYATNFAIVEDGVVTNVVWGMTYTPIPNAVQVDDRRVRIGDTYENGAFYHNGEAVRTRGEEMADMRSALALLGIEEETEAEVVEDAMA